MGELSISTIPNVRFPSHCLFLSQSRGLTSRTEIEDHHVPFLAQQFLLLTITNFLFLSHQPEPRGFRFFFTNNITATDWPAVQRFVRTLHKQLRLSSDARSRNKQQSSRRWPMTKSK
jgi:hypothetical protein